MYWKPTPKIFDVPGVGPKPVRDWTDEDVEAVARTFRERAERLGMGSMFDFSRLVLQMREEEREWLKTGRPTLLLEAVRAWLAWDRLNRWRDRDDEQDGQIEVEFAGEPPDQVDIDWGSEPPPDFAR